MSWFTRIGRAFYTARLDREIEEEQRFHMQARADELIEQGVAAQQAAQQARLQFGNTLQLREFSRDAKFLPWLESIVRDVEFGARMLRKNAALTAAAVVSLALAIGASVAAFTLIDALILRPLPVKDPRALFFLTYQSQAIFAENGTADVFSYPAFGRLRDAVRTDAEVFSVGNQYQQPVTIVGSQTEESAQPQWISGNAFLVLGIHAALGRVLTIGDDDKPGAHPVAVLSYDYWQRRFAGNTNVLGQWLTLRRDRQYQIIGVAQRGFSGVEPGKSTDIWVPNMMWTPGSFTDPTTFWVHIWARLKPGTSRQRIEDRLQASFTGFQHEVANGMFDAGESPARVRFFLDSKVSLNPAANGPSELRRHFERPLYLVGIVAMLVLLIACSNVANLFMARVTSRVHEMALRLSIGAGRRRLIQQLLLESALVAVVSSILGLLFARAAAPLIVDMLSTRDTSVYHSVIYLDVHPDWRVAAFLIGTSLLTTLFCGLAPALRGSNASLNDALKSGAAKHSHGAGLLQPLLTAQVAFCFVVLFAAALLLGSFEKLNHLDPGFARRGITLVALEPSSPGSHPQDSAKKANTAWLQLIDQVRRLPGVQAASSSGWGFFSLGSWTPPIRIPGRKTEAGAHPFGMEISPGFLETMRMRLVSGRDLTARDTEQNPTAAVLVNQAFARHYFSSQDAVGKRFFTVNDSQQSVPHTIVGIVNDAKYKDLRAPVQPTIYVAGRGGSEGILEVRSALEPSALDAELRKAIPRINPAFRIGWTTPESTVIEGTILRERLLAVLAGFFGATAMILAAVGLYGVLSYAVFERMKEIGIRLALGAKPASAARLILGRIGLAIASGLALGMVLGLMAARFLVSILFEVKPWDFSSVAVPLACLLGAAIFAAVPPAVRAARTDAAIALRYQ
ncbi:MAG: ABC transporter permease [Acidobacteriaceae bacterium]|nr:ABC transporter permease [Acidobacteriaceae bacterium]